MATRTFLSAVKTYFGGNYEQLRKEHNKLVDEMENLKAHYKVHTHSATSTAAPDGGSGTGFTPALTTTEAQKIA